MRRLAASDEAGLERYLTNGSARLGAGDQELLAAAMSRRRLARAVVESFRQGSDANQRDASSLVKP